MNNRHLTFGALFLVLFIDGMGQGILFPILDGTLLTSSTLLGHSSLAAREVWYSIVIGIFFVFWFIGGPIISDFSDSIGRKKSLLICLLGTFLGYVLTIVALFDHSIILLLLGRIIDGFTAGSQSVAQAAVSDSCQDHERENYMGLVLFSVTFGLIAGPLIGGLLSDHHLLQLLNFSTPLYFAAIIALVNFFLLIVFYKDTAKPLRKTSINLLRAVTVFKPVLKNKSLREFLTALFSLQIGWTTFFVYISLYVSLKFHFSSTHAGIFFGVVGLGLSIGYLYLVRKFQSITLSTRMLLSYFITMLLMLGTAICTNSLVLWPIALVMPAIIAIGYNSFFVILANNTNADQQGLVMGVAGAIGMPLSSTISSLVIVNFSHISLRLPLYIATIALAFGCMLLLRCKYMRSTVPK